MTALEPRALDGVRIDPKAPVRHCGTCGGTIWWGFTRAGRRNPFDVVDGQRTAVTHFSTCAQAREWSRR